MQDEVLDQETIQNLRDLAGDDATFFPQMIELFLNGAATKLPAIEAHLAAGRLAEVAGLCHQLKSSSGNLGALKLGKIFEQLEAETQQSNAAAAAQTYAQVKLAYPAVESALRALKG
jgi:two-component system sensor histidine kinase/response regulator